MVGLMAILRRPENGYMIEVSRLGTFLLAMIPGLCVFVALQHRQYMAALIYVAVVFWLNLATFFVSQFFWAWYVTSNLIPTYQMMGWQLVRE